MGFSSKASVLHYYQPVIHLVYTFNYYLLKIGNMDHVLNKPHNKRVCTQLAARIIR